jgi:hypothetical protein
MRLSDIYKTIEPIFLRQINGKSDVFLTPFLRGGPGLGKSSIVKQLAVENKAQLIDIRLATREPTDMTGLPYTVKVGEQVVTKFSVPAILAMIGTGPVVLFLDEFMQAPVLVRQAMSQLILDRCLGEYKLPRQVFIIAASNNKSDRAGTIGEMESNLKTRFSPHLEVHPDMDDFTQYAFKNNMHDSVIAFLRSKTDALYDFQPSQETFATPRTWEYVSELLRLDWPGGDGAARLQQSISGTVGAVRGTEFKAYQELWQHLPPTEEVLKNPRTVKLPEKGTKNYNGICFAITTSLVRACTPKNVEAVFTFFDRVEPEIAVAAIKDLALINEEVIKTKAFISWTGKNRQYIMPA